MICIVLGGTIGFFVWFLTTSGTPPIVAGQRFFITRLRPNFFFDGEQGISLTNPTHGHSLHGSFAEISDDWQTFTVTFITSPQNPRIYSFTILNFSSGTNWLRADMTAIVQGNLLRFSLSADTSNIVIRTIITYDVIMEHPDEETGELTHTISNEVVVLAFTLPEVSYEE